MEITNRGTPTLISAGQFVADAYSQEIDPNSRTAYELFLKSSIQPPPCETKVELYGYLEKLGLQNTSPLFCHLFEKYGQNLKLK